MLYLLHFSEPLGDTSRPRMWAQHYLGWCPDGTLDARVAKHRSGRGQCKLTEAAVARGLTLTVVWSGPGDRHEEKRMKRRHFKDKCELCNPTTSNVCHTPHNDVTPRGGPGE